MKRKSQTYNYFESMSELENGVVQKHEMPQIGVL